MKENMNNDTPSQYGSPELQAMIVERATPAATTSGAAGTIKRWMCMGDGMYSRPNGGYVTYSDHVAAVAAAREEEREKLEAAHSRALTRTEMESRRPAENERDALAQAIGNAAIKAGIAQAVDMTGPTLCMLADDMATELARLRAAPVVGELPPLPGNPDPEFAKRFGPPLYTAKQMHQYARDYLARTTNKENGNG